MNVLDRFAATGITFRLDGDRVLAKVPGPVTADISAVMRQSREQIRAELEAIESRRQRLLTLLAEQPGRKYAVVYDPDVSREYDVLMVAIPDATFEVRVPKPDDSLEFACRLMQTMDRHTRERKPA